MLCCERIWELREDAGMTQQAVADLLGVGQRTYCDYESGKTRIPVERVLMLAEYYDVSMDFICGASCVKGHFPRK